MADIRPSLLALAAQPDRITHARLWRALTKEERERAVQARLRAPDEWVERELFLVELAEALRFRTTTIRVWSDDKLATQAARNDDFSRKVVKAFLTQWHLSDRVPLLTRFLNDLRVSHRNGLVNVDFDRPPSPTETIAAAADALLTEFPPNDVFIYLLSLTYMYPKGFAALKPWLVDQVERGPSVGDREVPADDPNSAAMSVLTQEPEGFTTLDSRLVRVVVDAAQGIDGAPTEDELDDLIDEIIHLNSERHKSFFHAGLRDAVFKRPLQPELAAENESRRRWYLAGFTQGLARRQAWGDIVQVYDVDRLTKTLGDSGRGPSGAAARSIYRALCETNRPAEAARFLTPVAVARLVTRLGPDILEQGKRLVRSDRPAEAKITLTVLAQGLARAVADGESVPPGFDQELRRRLAHAHRQLGEVARAKELLEGLLEETNLDRRSMVLTDLGILECGYRRLADLRLPLKPEDVATFRETLERGEELFSAALQAGDSHTSHAHFCLGVLAFVRGDFELALQHLDEAVSGFETDPEAYRPAGLLSNARLCLGLAICQALAVGRMERAHELIREASRAGAQIPPHLVESTLAALEMGPEALGRGAAEAILEASGAGVLDIIAASPATRQSRLVASALLTRLRDEPQGLARRAKDGYAVLPLLLSQQRKDEAEEVLDVLEGAALAGEATNRFLDLLDAPQEYEPAWTREDALWSRVDCLEAAGLYDDARVQLEQEFHRLMAARQYGYLEDAEAIIERIEGSGCDVGLTGHLTRRLEAERKLQEPAIPQKRDTRTVIRVLVVGGNETQEQYDDTIREELKRSHGYVEVDFVHTGWTSNWGTQLEDIKRRLPDYDAVVVMRLIRTMLGRKVRAACGDIPWRGCGGRGKRAITNSILLAAGTTKGKLRLGG